MFTPQVGEQLPEVLQPDERQRAIADILALRNEFPKLDMPEARIRQFSAPPRSPEECVFALTTQTYAQADLKNQNRSLSIRRKSGLRVVRVLRFDGLGRYRRAQAGGIIPVGAIFKASVRIGQIGRARSEPTAARPTCVEEVLRVLAEEMGKSGGCMNTNISATNQAELTCLRELSARIGSDPLLTQASTGNSSIKLDDILWIKASGKWMADAIREGHPDRGSRGCQGTSEAEGPDPTDRAALRGASIETAMAAILPHRVALHIHCVNTIARLGGTSRPHRFNCNPKWKAYAGNGSHTRLRACRSRRRSKRSYLPSRTPMSSYWATTVWSSEETIAGGAVEDLLFEVQRRLVLTPAKADSTQLRCAGRDCRWFIMVSAR